jgi:hypothetical protein
MLWLPLLEELAAPPPSAEYRGRSYISMYIFVSILLIVNLPEIFNKLDIKRESILCGGHVCPPRPSIGAQTAGQFFLFNSTLETFTESCQTLPFSAILIPIMYTAYMRKFKSVQRHGTYFVIYDWPWLCHLGNEMNCSVDLCWSLIIQFRICTRWLRHYATSRKVAGSSADEVDIFNWPNPSSRTMALGSTQPLTEMSTRNLPGG